MEPSEIETRPLAVITGASTGIGYELAKVFAEEGHDLLIVAEDVGIMNISGNFSQYGGKVLPVQLDLASKDGAEEFYFKILETNRPVDFFVRANMMDTEVGQSEKDDPAKVARQGYDALMEGLDHVVAGSLRNKLNVVGAKIMSEKQGAKMQARATKPKSLEP